MSRNQIAQIAALVVIVIAAGWTLGTVFRGHSSHGDALVWCVSSSDKLTPALEAGQPWLHMTKAQCVEWNRVGQELANGN